MRLAKLQEFRNMIYTPDSAPALSTLRARIDRKQIPGGCKDGGRYYIDLDEFDRQNNLSGELREQRDRLAKSPTLAGLI